MSPRITWLGQSGYLLESAGHRLVLDPYFSDAVERLQGLRRLVPPPCPAAELQPDALLITHDHLDHFDEETFAAIMQSAPRCQLIGPASVLRHAEKIGLPAARLTPFARGATVTAGGFTLTATPAQHSDAAAIGLLVEAGALLLWFSGDTLYAPDLAAQLRALARRARRAPDVACICINGKLGNMNADEAVTLMMELRPRLAIPTHYGMFAENTADPAAFLAACRQRGLAAAALPYGRAIRIAELFQATEVPA